MAISLTGMRSVKVATFDISPHHPMQSFVRDVITGQWYVAQLNGTTDGVENLYIYRCSPDGQVLDKANLVKAGHGNSITIEHDGGDVYLWFRWTGINKPVRWRYSGTVAGKTITSSHADVTQYTSLEPSNTSTAYYSIDELAGRIASYRGQADGAHYLELRNLADYKSGTGSALHTIDITDYGIMQGFATVGDQVLVYRGAGYTSTDQHPPEIRVYSWATGAETGRLDVSGASGVNPGDASINEAEGIYVTPEGTIMHGLATGLMGTNVSTVYRLTSQSETVGEVGRATLVLDLQEVTGEPMGDAAVQVSYDRDVRTPGAGLVPRLLEGYIPLADRDRVQVVASDDPALSPESYGHRVRIDVRRGYPHGDKTYYAQTSIDGAAEVALSRILVPGPGKPGEMLKGPQGDDGPAGPGAYESAVANGFTGTEAEWLASLVDETTAAAIDGAAVTALNEAIATGGGTDPTYTTRTNEALNPQGANSGGWSVSGLYTKSVDTEIVRRPGTQSIKTVRAATSPSSTLSSCSYLGQVSASINGALPTTANQDTTFAAYFSAAQACRGRLTVTYYDSSNTLVGSLIIGDFVEAPADTSTWTRVAVTNTAPADSAKVTCTFQAYTLSGDSAGGEIVYVTDFSKGDHGDYFDGDMPAAELVAYSWSGEPHASTSVETTTVPGTPGLDIESKQAGSTIGSRVLIEWTQAEAWQPTTITRTSDGSVSTAELIWPDGSTGVLTVTPGPTGTVDGFTVTHVDSGRRITQPTVTRDSAGRVTTKPQLTVGSI